MALLLSPGLGGIMGLSLITECCKATLVCIPEQHQLKSLLVLWASLVVVVILMVQAAAV